MIKYTEERAANGELLHTYSESEVIPSNIHGHFLVEVYNRLVDKKLSHDEELIIALLEGDIEKVKEITK